MGELTARAFTEQALLDAWDEAREAALADGVGGAEIDKFEAAAARNISRLCAELADGSYKPHPVVAVDIAKSAGGTRHLAVPSLQDRDDCFERIPRWEVLRRLREVVPDAQAVDLIRRFMDRPVVGQRVARAERGLGLHQGSPLSPLLCNLYLDAFDRAMLAAGYRVIRYSDDLAIPVPDRAAAEQALADAADILDGLRLELNAAKSHVVSFDTGVQFLGSLVTSATSPGALALSHPLETVVYVDHPGSLLRSRGDRLTVEHQDKVLFRLNLRRVRQVVCIGRIGMTTPFLHRALREGIDVVLLDETGGPGGRLASLAHSDPTVRRAQYRLADDIPAARALATAFVDGKIANMRIALLRASRRSPDAQLTNVAETLAITRLLLPEASSHDEILGHEGSATREYFRAWRSVIGPDWSFSARERRPPPDPVNAMLSFGYTLLVHEAIAALGIAGLDPAVGFLHQARWGRPSLALDLIEEFRPLIVDTVVLRCLTTGIVRAGEFDTEPERGCRMNPHARHAFLAAYERRMLTLFTHEPSGRRVSYRVGVELQAKALARTILDPDHLYRAVRWK